MFTFVLVFVFVVLLTVLSLYVFNTYFFPRKLEEIAEMIEKGQTKLAINKLTAILEKDDRDIYARYLLAEAYKKENNKQFAIVEYRQLCKQGKFDDRVKEVDIRKKLARMFQEDKKTGEAKQEYLLLTRLDAADYENFYELGLIYYNAGIFEKALSYLKKAASLNTKHAMSYYYLGQIYYKSNANQEAKLAFLQAIKIEPKNYKAHYFLGLVLRFLGDYEWALKEFEIAQKSEEIKVKCYLAKGTCYLEKEQYPKSVIEFEWGLKYARRGSDSELNLRYFLGEAHEKMRDLQAAISQWEKIYAINKKFRDVEQKLRSFAEFRQDDRIKDFMIASLSIFEHTCRKLVESMGFIVRDVKIISDTDMEIFAGEPDDNRRGTRQAYRIVRILRTTNTISDNFLRRLHEQLKPRSAQRVVVISTGEFSQSAVDYANTRPVELVGKSQIIELLKNIQTGIV